jgi:DNA sulfur modification protein DndE
MQARDQLIRLKTRTGITQWNILCRWAFCVSLRQATPPTPIDVPSGSNVELTWQVFGGEAQELYLAVLKERCVREGLDLPLKKGSGTICAKHPPGRAGKWCLTCLTPFFVGRGISHLATPQGRPALDGLRATHGA